MLLYVQCDFIILKLKQHPPHDVPCVSIYFYSEVCFLFVIDVMLYLLRMWDYGLDLVIFLLYTASFSIYLVFVGLFQFGLWIKLNIVIDTNSHSLNSIFSIISKLLELWNALSSFEICYFFHCTILTTRTRKHYVTCRSIVLIYLVNRNDFLELNVMSCFF